MQEKFLSELHDLPQAIHDRVWADDLDRKGFWLSLAVRTTRLAWAVIRDLRSGDPSLRAMSLVYTTILSLVPLLAVSFSVLKGFGVHEELETIMMRSLLPLGEQGVEIGIRIVEFVENVKVGVLGSLGLALLLFTVISLMQKIERAFNRTWRVSQDRPFAQRFSGYLSVVIVGPVLVFSSMGITATLMSTDIVTSITAIEPFGTVMGWASALLPFALVVGAFTFIYVFMPNTTIHPVSAFTGSLVASALWHLAGWVFASFVVSSAETAAIYSAFAGLIVFMLWLHVSWLVLLIGASVAYYHQNPYQTTAGEGEAPLSPRMAERVSLALLSEVASAFQAGESSPTTDELVDRLHIPASIAQGLLQSLQESGFILSVGTPPIQWMPARPLDRIALEDVIGAVRAAGETTRLSIQSAHLPEAALRIATLTETQGSVSLAGKSLNDILPDKPAQPDGNTPGEEAKVAQLRDAASGE
jgi:membrane protein